jgi:hypothetical protein
MKFLYDNQKALKNGLYLDYFFKNVLFNVYKKFLSINFFYLIDKFIAEKIFFYVKNFFSYFFFINDFVKKLDTPKLIKIILLITIQLLLIILL